MLALRLGYNTGISFGMFASDSATNRLVLIGVTALVTIVMLIYALRSRDGLERAGLAAVVGGAAGNLTDRILRGRVTDFIDVHITQWHWPAFNLADTAICLGAMSLIWAALRGQVGQERKRSS
jgi:signal peptidase II